VRGTRAAAFGEDCGSVASVVTLGASAFLGRTELRLRLAPEAHVLAPAEALAGRLVLHAFGGTIFRGTARLTLVLAVAVQLGLPGTLVAVVVLTPPATDDGAEKSAADRAPPRPHQPCSRRAVVDGERSFMPDREIDRSGPLDA
jgi:hypothetical protein